MRHALADRAHQFGKTRRDQALDAAQNRATFEPTLATAGPPNELGPGANPQLISVTEHTTHHHLKTKK